MGPIPPGAVVLDGEVLEETLRRLLDERRPPEPLTGLAAYRAEWMKPSGIIPLITLIVTLVVGWTTLHGDVKALQDDKIEVTKSRDIFRTGINARVDAGDKRLDDAKSTISDRMDRGFDIARQRDEKRTAEIAAVAGDVKSINTNIENLVRSIARLEARQDRGPFGRDQGWMLSPDPGPFVLRASNACPAPFSPIVRAVF